MKLIVTLGTSQLWRLLYRAWQKTLGNTG